MATGRSGRPGSRTACLWCPDWPVTALRRSGKVADRGPLLVLGSRGRVRAASEEARADGAGRGLRKREAEARSPASVVVEADEALEAREFEGVARAMECVTHRLAVERPGLLTFPVRGPARYFGGEEETADRVLEVVTALGVDGRVGVAGSHFAASLAARHTTPSVPVLVVPAGETASFLGTRPVFVLGERGLEDLAGLLGRLGIRTLGDLAGLPEASMAARFGDEGLAAHRLARGLDERPRPLTEPPPDLAETAELDPPVAQVDRAAFSGKALADRFLTGLERRGLTCLRVTVEAETEHGEGLARAWTLPAGPTSAVLAQRIRWQLEAWLTECPGAVSGGLSLLRLVPEEVAIAGGRQLGFWGADEGAADDAARVLARLQGMLGSESVVQPVLRGGRTPTERTALRTWPLVGEPEREAPAPWPGTLPGPHPAVLCSPPLAARLLDTANHPVRVSGRGELSGDPARLECPVATGDVTAWGGPWPQDIRWWDPRVRRRGALFQVEAAGVACLVAVSGGSASVEALYD